MELTTLVFMVAGAIFLSMTVLTFLLVMPQIKARSNLKLRIATAAGKSGGVRGGLARMKAAGASGISNRVLGRWRTPKQKNPLP